METVSFIPLDTRVCIQMLVAGHLDSDGKTLPKCIGPSGIQRIEEEEP